MGHTDDQLHAFASWERRSWETRAASYAERITELTRGAADALLDAAEVTAGARVLDVATGPGVVALAARDRGAEAIAVDQSEAMVGLARTAGLDVGQARADRLPFADRAFDAVVGGFLVNHLGRPTEAVAELARVCRGGGRVGVSVWDVPEANPALGLFGTVAQSFEITHSVPPGPDSSLYADDDRLIALLSAAGLDDALVTRVGWTLTIDPGAWFDAVSAGTPRTGAVLAAATAAQRAALRRRYVEVATAAYGSGGGPVTLPATAVVGSARVGEGLNRLP